MRLVNLSQIILWTDFAHWIYQVCLSFTGQAALRQSFVVQNGHTTPLNLSRFPAGTFFFAPSWFKTNNNQITVLINIINSWLRGTLEEYFLRSRFRYDAVEFATAITLLSYHKIC
jgi:hypothetical protein